ncbi:MAG: hypothetical protein ACWGMZ_00805 [Thermoguttaceae bacterium]
MNRSELEHKAVEAHRQNMGWLEFWPTVAEDAKRIEPYSREKYRRLVQRLLHLLTTGEPGGEEPPRIAEPWERDDAEASKPADVGTQARFDWSSLMGNEATV